MLHLRYFLILWLLGLSMILSAQKSKITFIFGYVHPKLVLKHGNLPLSIQNIGTKEGMMTGLQVNTPLCARLTLNTEIGLSSTTSYLDYTIVPKGQQQQVNYYADYRINQYYIAFIPRFYVVSKWLFINGGPGYFGNFNNKFINGTAISEYPNFSRVDLEGTGQHYTEKNFWGYFAGIGICPAMSRNIGLLIEVRAAQPFKMNDTDGVGLHQRYFAFSVGCSLLL